jgi:hypothetical protein
MSNRQQSVSHSLWIRIERAMIRVQGEHGVTRHVLLHSALKLDGHGSILTRLDVRAWNGPKTAGTQMQRLHKRICRIRGQPSLIFRDPSGVCLVVQSRANLLGIYGISPIRTHRYHIETKIRHQAIRNREQ